jgi:hypothetical protein
MADFEEKVKAAFDAEFDRTRPRPGLRGRVIANAVATPRVRRRGFGAWLTPPRLAVAGAAAAVLVVAGVGLRVATQGGPTVAVKPTPTPLVLAFGPVPPANLHPTQGQGAGGGAAPAVQPYFGPATMTWKGQLPKVPASAPLYRFALPTAADADAFAARLGGRLLAAGGGLEPRTYRLPGGYQMNVALEDPVAAEATFTMNRDTGPNARQPLGEVGARTAADAELARLNLTPSWTLAVSVAAFTPLGDTVPIYNVQYQRVIQVSKTETAGEVDGDGNPAGVLVTVDSNGKVLRIAGILRLAEESASYPLRAPSTVVDSALKAPAIEKGPPTPPAVSLTSVTLVYITVSSTGVGYLEPAYLFTGRYTVEGATLEKRVIVPALAPRAIGSPSP